MLSGLITRETVGTVLDSTAFGYSLLTIKYVGIGIAGLGLLLAAITILRRYFRRHEYIEKIHQFILTTFTAIAIGSLIIAGILGLFLPIVPGLLLLFFALVLIRRHYRSPFIERQYNYLELKLRFIRGVQKTRRRVKERVRKVGKALRKHRRLRRRGARYERTHKRKFR